MRYDDLETLARDRTSRTYTILQKPQFESGCLPQEDLRSSYRPVFPSRSRISGTSFCSLTFATLLAA
jgi:hypothetical protein